MLLTKNSVIRGKYDTYRINNILPASAGGMAQVAMAVNSQGQEVVIKSAKITGDGNDDMRLDKLKVEAEILKGFGSDASKNCIVRYIDESAQGNDFSLIIEKINGKTLKEIVNLQPLSEVAAMKYLANLVKALNYLHRHNVIHRDVKPTNIIIDPTRGPILIDFGAAKLGWTQMKTGSETIIGTMGWSCPHQFRGGLSTSCDIYSVGAVLFFMITGKEPKFYMNSNGTLTKKPDAIRSGISNELATLVINSIDPEHQTISSAEDLLLQPLRSVSPTSNQPYILLEGVKYPLQNETDIGRVHQVCDQNCRAVGYQNRPAIPIDEGGKNFISKHHVRIWKDRNGYFWVQDLRSKNGTAIFSSGSYRRLSPGKKEMLNPKSVVALCYNSNKGAYVTFTFHET